MAKIESIRPGGTLASTFSSYPLAELLIGILRGNLSGRLDVFLHPEPRNHMFFKNGVPIVVDLPDSGASLVQILIQAGSLPREKGLDLLRLSEASGRSQVALIQQHKLLSPGALHEALHRRARAQVVRLFDVGPAEFRFAEGASPPSDVVPTILQPLPIVYEGLTTTKDADTTTRFFGAHRDHAFVLSGTYPHGIDPFEWGAQVEAAIGADASPLTPELLVERGLSERVAASAIMSAYLAGMMEVEARRRPSEPVPVADPRLVAARRSVSRAGGEGDQKDPSGLVIHRRSQIPDEPTLPPRRMLVEDPSSSSSSPKSQHDADYTAVRDRLAPFRDQNYLQLLRITPGTESAQLERAHRFLLRKLDDEGDDVSIRALKDLIADAMDVLRDSDRAKRYALMVEQGRTSHPIERERLTFEAETKVERAFRAMAADRTGEATYLLSWAEKQDPTRTDVPVLFAVIDYLRSPAESRSSDAKPLATLIEAELGQRPQDWRVRLCYALLLAEQNDGSQAKRQIANIPDPEHPMVQRIRALL